jgi:hypothetical protein
LSTGGSLLIACVHLKEFSRYSTVFLGKSGKLNHADQAYQCQQNAWELWLTLAAAACAWP